MRLSTVSDGGQSLPRGSMENAKSMSSLTTNPSRSRRCLILTVHVLLFGGYSWWSDACGQTVDNPQILLDSYRAESAALASRSPDREQVREFNRHWFPVLLSAADREDDRSTKIGLLSAAEAIANSLGEYRESVRVAESLVELHQRGGAQEADLQYWWSELGQVSQLAWESNRGERQYFEKAFNAFVTVIQSQAMTVDAQSLKVLAAGWLADLSMQPSSVSNHDQLRMVRNSLDESLKIFNESFVPSSRLANSGFTRTVLLSRASSLDIWTAQYDSAIDRLRQYRSSPNWKMSPSMVVVLSDQSPWLLVKGQDERSKYLDFLERWYHDDSAHPDHVRLPLIAARSDFTNRDLKSAEIRYETILEKHLAEIEKLPDADYLLAEVWTNLTVIYSQLGKLAQSHDAAVKSKTIKNAIGQSTSLEEQYINRGSSVKEVSKELEPTPARPRGTAQFRWIIWSQVILIAAVGIGIWRYRAVMAKGSKTV